MSHSYLKYIVFLCPLLFGIPDRFWAKEGPENIVLTLVTEDYPPFNMMQDDKISGISTEILTESFKKSKIPFQIHLYPWYRAFKMGFEDINTAVFSTYRTPEREHSFKWVGPLAEDHWTFFAKSPSSIKIQNYQDAQKYKVGGYKEDAISLFLLKKGFVLGKNLLLANNEKENAHLLENGSIDLWATGSSIGPWISKTEKTTQIVNVLSFKKSPLYAAFNKETDDKLIKTLNKNIAQMKKSGEIKKIQDKYFH